MSLQIAISNAIRGFNAGGTPAPSFTSLLLSGTWTSPYNRIYSTLNTSSTANNTFNAGITSGLSNYVWNFFPYQGKILFGGFFTTYNGATANYFAEINPDGTLSRTGIGTGFNNSVRAIHIEPDGKIICAGTFTSYNGVSVNRIVRLNTNFTIDATFNVGSGFDNEVNHLVSDGTHIYIVGGFTTYKGVSRNRIAKIRISDGTDDTGSNSGINDTLFGIAIQGDFIYVTGNTFTTYNGGATAQGIVKINKNTLVQDTTFRANMGTGISARAYCYSQITSTHLYLCGNFNSINSIVKPFLARISLNGVVDSSFISVSPNGNVLFARLINNNTKLAITGQFSNLGGMPSANRFGAYDVVTGDIDAAYNLNLSLIGTTIGEY
jgi:hypothetical protein